MKTPTIEQLSADLRDQMKPIESMLPAGMEVKRFMRTAINAISTHAQADKLLKADRQSLFNACQKAAGDGLLIDGREATLVVFRDNKQNKEVVSYIPMVQGLVKLARNSGDIGSVIAEVVHQNDKFVYRPGIDSEPLFNPDWFGDRGQPVGCYAVVTTKDGEKITSVLPRDRILAIGQGGRNSDQYVPGKGAHYGEWWKKTAIKNVLKYAPKSTCLESAMSHDNELIDVDAIPCTEDSRVVKLQNRLHGDKVTARTVSQSPPARLETAQIGDPSQDPIQNTDDSEVLAEIIRTINECTTQKQLNEIAKDLKDQFGQPQVLEIEQAMDLKMTELSQPND